MKLQLADAVLPFVTAVLATVSLCGWLATVPAIVMETRLPNQDGDPLSAVVTTEIARPPEPAGALAGPGVAADLQGTWPGFRGSERDGICHGSPPLQRQWPSGGPRQVWTVTLGEGYAGAVIGGGCVYVLDYDEQARADTLRCLSLQDGREIWHNSYPVFITRNHGLSRTVPALIDDCVITIGPRCHVACWDQQTGACRWLMDLEQQFGATVPRWYAGQCPLVDEGRLILAPGGSALLVAVDYQSGEIIWESPNPRKWSMTHSSIMPLTIGTDRQYVYCASGGVVGVSAADGALLWDSDEWPEQFATAPSPVPLPDGKVLVSSGYGSKIGSLILQIRAGDGGFAAETITTLTPRQFNSEQQTPIFLGDHLYAVRKRGGGQLVCLEPDGVQRWDSGSDKFGHGPYLIADGMIFVMDNGGRLTLAEATADRYVRLAQAQIFPDGHDAWGPMAMASGRLVLRDLTRMTCLDVTR